MMSRYSINGYIIAIRNRSTHTVCVEGKYDRLAVKHCLIKMCGNNDHLNSKYVVDTMELIDTDSSIYGNKEKLKAICEKALDTGIEHKITALADREYECFDITEDLIDKRANHHIEDGILHITRGHSLENYFFEENYLINFIEYNFPSTLTGTHRTIIFECWPTILKSVAALTFSIHEYNYCKRSKDLFNMDNWRSVDLKNIEIDDDSISSSLATRGISIVEATSIMSRAKAIAPLFDGTNEVSRWISHGHIGMDLICGAIAKILSMCGVDNETCKGMHGFREIKFKFLASEWIRNSQGKPDSFPDVFFNRIFNSISN